MSEDTDINQGHAPDDAAAFILRLPAHVRSPMVFAVPHSGRTYPDAFRTLSQLDEHKLRLSEDAFVDELFEPVVSHGTTMLIARYARAYLDLNRAIDELDPNMFNGALDGLQVKTNSRVKAGLGVVPRIIGEGMAIYDGKIPARDAVKRLQTVYMPYHQQLAELIKARKEQFGTAVLIDCHSMPSGPELHKRGQEQPDIILGDCWGASCMRELTSLAERLFLTAGFKVRRNVPYAGGFVTRHYGQPDRGQHALQIEVNRRIYMDEKRVEKLPHFNEVRDKLQLVTKELTINLEPFYASSRKRAAE